MKMKTVIKAVGKLFTKKNAVTAGASIALAGGLFGVDNLRELNATEIDADMVEPDTEIVVDNSRQDDDAFSGNVEDLDSILDVENVEQPEQEDVQEEVQNNEQETEVNTSEDVEEGTQEDNNEEVQMNDDATTENTQNLAVENVVNEPTNNSSTETASNNRSTNTSTSQAVNNAANAAEQAKAEAEAQAQREAEQRAAEERAAAERAAQEQAEREAAERRAAEERAERERIESMKMKKRQVYVNGTPVGQNAGGDVWFYNGNLSGNVEYNDIHGNRRTVSVQAIEVTSDFRGVNDGVNYSYEASGAVAPVVVKQLPNGNILLQLLF